MYTDSVSCTRHIIKVLLLTSTTVNQPVQIQSVRLVDLLVGSENRPQGIRDDDRNLKLQQNAHKTSEVYLGWLT